MTTEAAEGPDQPALMAERRGQYPQGEAGEAASVTAVKEYAHEEPADVAGSFVLHEPPWYGTVCPVVWEDGGSNPASYPIYCSMATNKPWRSPQVVTVLPRSCGSLCSRQAASVVVPGQQPQPVKHCHVATGIAMHDHGGAGVMTVVCGLRYLQREVHLRVGSKENHP